MNFLHSPKLFSRVKTVTFTGLFLFLLFNLISCTNPSVNPLKGPPEKDHISLMAYNVENLFDTQKDPLKNDDEYLPLALKRTEIHQKHCRKLRKKTERLRCLYFDWSESLLETKLSRLGAVIRQVHDRGPDILVLEEVENISILKRLRDNYLQSAGYRTLVLLEGSDPRGIDVGLLSRLPLSAPPRLHNVDFSAIDAFTRWRPPQTRGILEVQLQLPQGPPLIVLGVHLPSQAHPLSQRQAVLKNLSQIQKSFPPTSLVVAMGDFNLTEKDLLNGDLLDQNILKNWEISHFLGCRNCLGTHYYRGKWSFLDMILFSKSFENGPYKINPESITTPKWAPKQINQNSKNQEPLRFTNSEGVSDHLPIYSEISPVL